MSNLEIPECSVCLEELTKNLSVLNDCGHIFHTNCLQNVIQCPICRSNIFQSTKIQGYEIQENNNNSNKLTSQNINMKYIQTLTQQKNILYQENQQNKQNLQKQNEKNITLENNNSILKSNIQQKTIQLELKERQNQKEVQELKAQNREQQVCQEELLNQLMAKDQELETQLLLKAQITDEKNIIQQNYKEKNDKYQKLKKKYLQLKNLIKEESDQDDDEINISNLKKSEKENNNNKSSNLFKYNINMDNNIFGDKKNETKKNQKVNNTVTSNKIRNPSMYTFKDEEIKNKTNAIKKVKPSKTVNTDTTKTKKTKKGKEFHDMSSYY